MNHRDDSNLKARRFPSSITTHDPTSNNKGRTSTPVDSFVQLNLTRETPPIDIKLEDYKKVTSISLSLDGVIENTDICRPLLQARRSKPSKDFRPSREGNDQRRANLIKKQCLIIIPLTEEKKRRTMINLVLVHHRRLLVQQEILPHLRHMPHSPVISFERVSRRKTLPRRPHRLNMAN
jgi:hypothetical protein